MKTFQNITIDGKSLTKELSEFESFLVSHTHLKERAQVLPFFKSRPHLTAAIGMLNGASVLPDRYAHELDLFGDFAADAASGDFQRKSFTLIEFEAAEQFSIFSKKDPLKTMRRWNTRFEHGFSQLVDWAWRLAPELSSDQGERIFGVRHPHINFILIIGRDADLNPEDINRLTWRANNMSLGAHRMSCFTFDGVYDAIKGRLAFAQQIP